MEMAKGGGLMIVSYRGETWNVGKVSSAPDCHFALKIINVLSNHALFNKLSMSLLGLIHIS